MVSPDDASEIACPIVAQAVFFVLQLLPSSPVTPLTYHVAASAGETRMIRERNGTPRLFNMLTPSRTICLPQPTDPRILSCEPECVKHRSAELSYHNRNVPGIGKPPLEEAFRWMVFVTSRYHPN